MGTQVLTMNSFSMQKMSMGGGEGLDFDAAGNDDGN